MSLPKNWEEKELGEVAEVFNGKTPSNAEKRESGHPMLKIRDVDENGYFRGLFNSFIDDKFFERYKSKIIHDNDSLILNAAHNSDYVGSKIFRANSLPTDTIATGEWLIIRANEKELLSNFKHYLVLSKYFKAKIKGKVGKEIHLYPRDVKKIKIPVPPLETQKCIVSILERAEKLKEKRKQANELLQRSIRSEFNALCFPSDEWPELSFSDFATVEKNSVLPKDIYPNENYVGLEHIEKETGKILALSKIAKDELKSNKFRFTKKNILYGKLRPYLNKVATPEFEGICSTDILPILPNEKIVTKEYLSTLMKTKLFVKFASSKTEGANLPRLNPKALKEFRIRVPPKENQECFSKFSRMANTIEKAQTDSNLGLSQLFDSLMQKAFNGELVSQ